MKRRVPILSRRLTKRIVAQVKKGVTPDVAARLSGVSLDVWATWMTRRGALYRDLAAQIDQAQAQAEAEYVTTLRKMAKGGKHRAVVTWLQARASERWPARVPVHIGVVNNTTLVQQIKALPSSDEFARMSPKAKAKALELAEKMDPLLGGILRMELRAGELRDPRDVLSEEERAAAQAALPPASAQEALPEARMYEAVGYTATRPDVLDMLSVPST